MSRKEIKNLINSAMAVLKEREMEFKGFESLNKSEQSEQAEQ